jgi:hypothetical protein
MALRTMDEPVSGLDELRRSPSDLGTVELLVRRPAAGEREIVTSVELDLELGMVGDNWRERGSRHTPDGSAEIERQLTLMNARAARLFAGDDHARWAEAGDQIYVDLDLSTENLPPGTRLQLGAAVVEVTEKPHTGCAKFSDRFGPDALRLVGTPEGVALRARGINARVVEPGTVSQGDGARKL